MSLFGRKTRCLNSVLDERALYADRTHLEKMYQLDFSLIDDNSQLTTN